MTNDIGRGRMYPTKDGFLLCPACRHKLIRIEPDTKAAQLPVYCRKCRRYLTVNIDRGQCFQSPCPDRPISV